MKIIPSIAEMKEWARGVRGKIGLVPTMGFLHEGHLSLVRKSLDTCDFTVVSLFVNPAQFGPGEDLGTYPRDIGKDRETLRALDVDVLFLPETGEIYPPGFKTYVHVEEITSSLCGISRPLFFRGVATVVLKLFNIVRPGTAFFGEKDWQQLQVIRTLVRDLNLDVAIESVPIVREPDGLAMSSRNRYLSPEERRSARVLHRGLKEARSLVARGEVSAKKIRGRVRTLIEGEPHASLEYLAVCDPLDFTERGEVRGKTLVALAVRVGKTRLIDNCIVENSECR